MQIILILNVNYMSEGILWIQDAFEIIFKRFHLCEISTLTALFNDILNNFKHKTYMQEKAYNSKEVFFQQCM